MNWRPQNCTNTAPRYCPRYCGFCWKQYDHTPSGFDYCTCNHAPDGAVHVRVSWTEYWGAVPGESGAGSNARQFQEVFDTQADADAYFQRNPLQPEQSYMSAQKATTSVHHRHDMRRCVGMVQVGADGSMTLEESKDSTDRHRIFWPEFFYGPQFVDGRYRTTIDFEWEDGSPVKAKLPFWGGNESHLGGASLRYGGPVVGPIPGSSSSQIGVPMLSDLATRSASAYSALCAAVAALEVFVEDPAEYQRLAASRKQASDTLDALLLELRAMPLAERHVIAEQIANAVGVYWTRMDDLDAICDWPESFTDICQIAFPGGADCFYQRFGVQQAEAGSYSVLPRPDVGEGIFSISWRMPLIEEAPNVLRPDPRATHHYIQVTDCLSPGASAPIVLAVADVVTR